MESRKKVLLLFYRFPYPPFGGDTYKGYNMLIELSKYHNISLVCLTEKDIPKAHQEEIEKYVKKLVIIKTSKFQSMLLASRFVFNKKPIQSNYFYNKKAQIIIDELLTDSDLVIPVTIRMFQYVKDSSKTILFDAVDSISLNYKNAKDKVKSRLWKLIYSIESSRVYKAEREAVSQSQSTFFVNHEEALYWSKFGRTLAVPNGVHNELLHFKEEDGEKDNTIVFFGKMDYQPNLDALTYLEEKILPLVDEEIKIKVVGLDPQGLCAKKYKGNAQVQVLGFLDKPEGEISKSLAAVLPMQIGGGIQNKILQCMAISQLVITTSLGANPIKNAKHNKHLLVADSPEAFAEYIKLIHENRADFKEIGAQAHTLIKREYSWEMYGETLNELINEKEI